MICGLSSAAALDIPYSRGDNGEARWLLQAGTETSHINIPGPLVYHTRR